MNLPVIVVGGGGHAKVLIDTISRTGTRLLGYVDSKPGGKLAGADHLGNDEYILRQSPTEIRLINGVGVSKTCQARRGIYERFSAKGFEFQTVIHPSAIIACGVKIGPGAQLMAGAVIQPDVSIGADAIVNTNASVDHDCFVGHHVHIAPGAVLSGNVTIGDCVFIGAGAVVIQGRSVGAGAIVAAGAVIIRDVPEGFIAIGVPGRIYKSGSNE